MSSLETTLEKLHVLELVPLHLDLCGFACALQAVKINVSLQNTENIWN